jgi:hypothetical protein
MAEHLKKSEAELNELLAEYWKLRHETGNFFYSVCIHHSMISRGIHGNTREQTKHECFLRLMGVSTGS